MTSVIFLLVGLLITVGLGIAVYRKAKGPSTRQQTTTPPTGAQPAQSPQQRRQFPTWAKVTLGVIAVVMVLSIAGSAVTFWLSSAPAQSSASPAATQRVIVLDAKETTFIVTANKGNWTETYHFPPAMLVEWRALNPNGRFIMKTQDGEYTFTPEKSDKPGMVVEASFTAIGDAVEKIQIKLMRPGTPVAPTPPPPSTAPLKIPNASDQKVGGAFLISVSVEFFKPEYNQEKECRRCQV